MAGRRGSPRVTQAQRATFITQLKINGNVRQSAIFAGFDPQTAYDHRSKDAIFAQEWAGALLVGHQNLRDSLVEEAVRRARDGTEGYVVSLGRMVQDPVKGGYLTEKKHSDSLMAKLLEGFDPDRFAKKQAGVTVNVIPTELQPDPVPEPDEPGPDKPIL